MREAEANLFDEI